MSNPRRPLTPQQTRIARAVARGENYKKIARDLHISINTVRAHVTQIAYRFDDDPELPPRLRICLWVRQKDWEATHAHKLSA